MNADSSLNQPSRKDKTASMDYELNFLEAGKSVIIGIDEAGYGAWAGPVSAGAVCLPLKQADLLDILHGVKDSKQMTALQREQSFDVIQELAIGYGVGYGTPDEINAHGIVFALTAAVRRAYGACLAMLPDDEPDMLLMDGVRLWQDCPLADEKVERIIKGDTLSISIAAASVLAKVSRDRYMMELAIHHPNYAFEKHKGYGTMAHRVAIEQHGVLYGIHRTYYKPIAALMTR